MITRWILLVACITYIPLHSKDTSEWALFAHHVLRFGYMCDQFIQTIQEYDEDMVAQYKRDAVEHVRTRSHAALAHVIEYRHAHEQWDTSVAQCFCADVVELCGALNLINDQARSAQKGALVSVHNAVIATHLETLQHFFTTCYASDSTSMIDQVSCNYLTTFILPFYIQYGVAPYYALRRSRQLLTQWDVRVRSVLQAIAPLPLGYGIARMLRFLQEERYYKNQDRAYDEQLRQAGADRARVVWPPKTDNADHARIHMNRDVRAIINGISSSATWWQTYRPMPRIMLFEQDNTKINEGPGGAIARALRTPYISVSCMDMCAHDCAHAVMRNVRTLIAKHPAHLALVEIRDIDCLENSMAGTQYIERLLVQNRYSNMIIVATAQNMNDLPGRLQPWSTTIQV